MVIVLRILGILVILGGIGDFYIGLSSVLKYWGHDLNVGIYHGIYMMIAGVGLVMLKKWGIIATIIPLGILAFLNIQLILTDKPADPIFLSLISLLSVCLIVFFVSQWKRCSWK